MVADSTPGRPFIVIFTSPARGYILTGLTKSTDTESVPELTAALAASERAILNEAIGRLSGVRTDESSWTLGTFTLTRVFLANLAVSVCLELTYVRETVSTKLTAPFG